MSVLAPDSTFAGCRIERVAGQGGMGIVYRATQLPGGRAVAVKVVAPHLAADSRFHERFEREARVATALEHPNVVPVLSSGEEDGRLYLVMDWVQGTDLQALIARSGGLAPGRAAEIVGRVGAALEAAHAAGLVHRDVKPANVLIAGEDGSGHVYLSDFGLTLELAADARLTQSGEWMGTAAFMAPEQFEGGRIDARTDVYALGCLLYAALTGGAPFPRETVAATMLAHLREPPPKPSSGGAPGAFDAVVARALSKLPADRYPSVAALVDAAAAAASGAGSGASPTIAMGNGLGAPEAAASQVPTARITRAGARRRPLAVVGGAGAVLGVAAAAAALLGAGPFGPDRASGPLTRAEVSGALNDFARAYAREDERGLATTLAPGVARVTPTDTQRGRSAVTGSYRRQFAANATEGYSFEALDITPGSAARASGRYAVTRSGAGRISGRIVFGVERDRGQPRIALIAATPDP